MANGVELLRHLGVFGFDKHAPLIMAALVTEDPMILCGKSGTGKTLLLNALSNAMELRHRHYNASLISFDDLVGFPYPDDAKETIRFLETPATVWGAQSVLIDEISRCKPEHQNRLFSLINERKVQGIELPDLRYRWAAMNPPAGGNAGGEDYIGSEPLDAALADRFALFVPVTDWEALEEEDRRSIAHPSLDPGADRDGGKLVEQVARWRQRFISRLRKPPKAIIDYVTVATTALNAAKVRISPRRAKLMSRSLLAASIVRGRLEEEIAKLVLKCSIPQVVTGRDIPKSAVDAAHRLAWGAATNAEGRWLDFMFAEPQLDRRLDILMKQCPSSDAGSQAIAQLLAAETPDRAAAFAFVLYPAAVQGRLPIGAEGVNDLGRLASPILSVDGEVRWQANPNQPGRSHPAMQRYQSIIAKLTGPRAARATQFFAWAAVNQVAVADPEGLEREINTCVRKLAKQGPAR